MLEIGLGRVDISAYEVGISMLGWGQRTNRTLGVAKPLHARAVVIADPESGSKLAYVVVELLLVSQGARGEVIRRLVEDHPELGLAAHNVMLTANHTHSGPSGFSHHFWVNLASPGFSRVVYERVVSGIVEAIRLADAARRPGRVRCADEVVALSEAICFNRSWFAYSRNPEVEPVDFEGRDAVTERRMTQLRFEDASGRPVGVLNWLAVHCTSVHAENSLLHPDNKGVAARGLEADLGGEGVALFAQEAAGDVSPNYRYHPGRKKVIGRFDDDFESADYVGDVQARYARRLLDAAIEPDAVELTGPIGSAIRWVDFSGAPVDAAFVPAVATAALNGERPRTAPAVLGLSMAGGTAEGPGPIWDAAWVRWLSRARGWLDRRPGLGRGGRQRRFDPKVPLLDLGEGLDGRFLGLFGLRGFRVPPVDPAIKFVRDAIRSGALPEGPWIPQTLPVQLFRIGPLAIAASPFEITTIAGRRLRDTLLKALAPQGVTTVIINPYANAYAGYMTTFEEYQCQHYEAGYTLFGPFSLGALRTAFVSLAEQSASASSTAGTPPSLRTDAELDAGRFREPWPDAWPAGALRQARERQTRGPAWPSR